MTVFIYALKIIFWLTGRGLRWFWVWLLLPEAERSLRRAHPEQHRQGRRRRRQLAIYPTNAEEEEDEEED